MSSHPAQRMLYPLLRPFGAAYGALMAMRRRRYEEGTPQCTPAVPTVSVGNIGWGGSGKTPVTEWLLQWAAGAGVRPVVLTRGYKASPPRVPFLVTPDATAEQAGDEPLMLARNHFPAHVIVDPVRSRAVVWAQKHLAPQLFILDDGFQHLAVCRQCDLVLLTPADLDDEWNRVIPCGSWRENANALTRAHAILIKATPEEFDTLLPRIRQRLGHLNVPVFNFYLVPRGWHSVGRAERPVRPDLLKDRGYLLFSGVGNPAQVEATVSVHAGFPPVRHVVYSDHHAYTVADIRRMAAEGLPMVCTPKDAVKLASLPLPDEAHVVSFALETHFGAAWNTNQSFTEWWQDTWQAMLPA